jgi:hypothetical protein
MAARGRYPGHIELVKPTGPMSAPLLIRGGGDRKLLPC